ncbi:LPS assembly protein LptD [Vulcaniibacterium tengchongense]|uniref:LPS-assembly protein LptD n=1 Tax=Vulcaniibacterium tengchongense TaxID=1273429 RepID=A0A3N4VEA2_9GAMM|nr:LPS assembly protein LptD [Vulcaniibacterium tengchongense]RPE75487.1 LPS-assembly protein [Vulcaniibacterium tengchongense]
MRPSLRLLPLPLCIALALPAHAADGDEENWGLCPIFDAVPSFEDAPAPVGDMAGRAQQPTDIEGDQLERGAADQDIVVQDNVRLSRGDQFLGTDKLTYNEESGHYTAIGNVRYQDSGMRIVAERAEGNQNADTHRIEGVRYQLTERRGNGGAERIELHGAQGALVGSSYSTCDPRQRAWELRAHRIDLDTEEGMGVARNATVRIGKIPVLYVPWFMFPIDDRRRTGLLYPSVSMSGRNGFDWRQPIYLNLAPNYDATLYPRYMSDRGFNLGAEFRWLYPNGRGEVFGNWMPSDRLPGNEPDRYLLDLAGNPIPGATLPEKDRGQFGLTAVHHVNDTWYGNTNLGWVSDTHYFEDFSNSLYGISNYSIRSDLGLYGRGEYWQAGLMADHYQLTDYTLSERSLQFDRLPRAYGSWARPFGAWLQAGIDGEAVRFEHTEFLGGSRLDLKPYVAMPLEGASWFLRPKLAWRYTAYQLEGSAQTRAEEYVSRFGGAVTPELLQQLGERNPTRSLPIFSLDAGLYFDRNIEFRGERFLNTLEPRIYYLRAPYRDQSGLPVFDTNTMTFSWGQLFRDNRYTGADRQTDANQVTTALTTRFISEEDGRERLAASIGQITYFDDVRVTLPYETPIERGKSAWVAETSVSPNDRWTIGASYMWDPKVRDKDLATLRARYLFGDAGIVNIGYRYRRNAGYRPGIDDPDTKALLEQVDFSFLYPINQTWSVVGRYYYSLRDDKPLETIAGVQWESCCLAARLVGRRYLRDRDGELDTRIMFEFELKGLSSVGQNTERVLRRAILGYDRDDLYLVPPSSTQSLNNGGGQVDQTDPTL